MTTEKPVTFTIPTELARSDGFADMAVLLGTGLGVWWLALRGVPVWAFIPVLIILSIWTLTGKPAADVPFIGALASGLRSKLGLRRAHEWVMAFLHYFRVRIYPDWMRAWRQSRLNSKIVTLTHSPQWLQIISALRSNRLRRWYMRHWLRVQRRRARQPARVLRDGLAARDL